MFVKPSSSAVISVPALTKLDLAAAEASCCFCGVAAWSRLVRLSRASCNCALRSLWLSSQTVGSDMGAPPAPGPVSTEWRAPVFELELANEEGRLRNARHMGVFFHLSSSALLIVCKYFSRPCLLCSVSSGEETVDLNHDFPGIVAGGAVPTCSVKD